MTCRILHRNYFFNSRIYCTFQAIIVTITLALVSVGTWGTFNIRQHFDPILLLPGESYLRQWIDVHDKHFPKVRIRIRNLVKCQRALLKYCMTVSVLQDGWVADVYTGALDPQNDLIEIDHLTQKLEAIRESEEGILKGVDTWWSHFTDYLQEVKSIDDWRTMFPSEGRENGSFPMMLSSFLFSRQGSKYKKNFIFKEPLVCNQPAPPIKVWFDHNITCACNLFVIISRRPSSASPSYGFLAPRSIFPGDERSLKSLTKPMYLVRYSPFLRWGINFPCYLYHAFNKIFPKTGLCGLGDRWSDRVWIVEELGPGHGVRLCHHFDSLGQFPNLYYGFALRLPHLGKTWLWLSWS